MTQFTCKVSNRSITGYHLNTFTIRISQRFSSAREFQMGNFQKYWSQNVGQDFIALDFFVGGRSCGRKRCVREINVSRAWDPVHAGDKALTRKGGGLTGMLTTMKKCLWCNDKYAGLESSRWWFRASHIKPGLESSRWWFRATVTLSLVLSPVDDGFEPH
jgi:hypothetical protein